VNKIWSFIRKTAREIFEGIAYYFKLILWNPGYVMGGAALIFLVVTLTFCTTPPHK
jgi:hypothetical protein